MATSHHCDYCNEPAVGKPVALMLNNHVYKLDLCEQHQKSMREFAEGLDPWQQAHKKDRDGKRSFTDSEKKFLFFRDKGICGLCDEPVNEGSWSADHVIPHSLGGPSSVDNGQVTHPKCNSDKSDMTWDPDKVVLYEPVQRTDTEPKAGDLFDPKSRRKNAVRHGTWSGYIKHMKEGGSPCGPCQQAQNDYYRGRL